MKNDHRFFANRECEYYPCHESGEDINCLFCFCPLYPYRDCPGNPCFKEKDGKTVKSCVDCTFPHAPQNYGKVMEYIKRLSE